MRFYITKESSDKVKNSFLNSRSFYFINTQELIEAFYLIKNIDYYNFLVNEEIKNRIIEAAEKKKYSNIVYVNENLSIEIVENLKDIVKTMSFIEKMIFVDEETKEENRNIYTLFDEIIFFPSQIRKIKIIECESIKNPLYYWLNNQNVPSQLH